MYVLTLISKCEILHMIFDILFILNLYTLKNDSFLKYSNARINFLTSWEIYVKTTPGYIYIYIYIVEINVKSRSSSGKITWEILSKIVSWVFDYYKNVRKNDDLQIEYDVPRRSRRKVVHYWKMCRTSVIKCQRFDQKCCEWDPSGKKSRYWRRSSVKEDQRTRQKKHFLSGQESN